MRRKGVRWYKPDANHDLYQVKILD
jgi:hypothetical protein